VTKNMKFAMVALTVWAMIGSLPAWAAGPIIGLAVSSGRLVVDRAPVEGNASLTEGMTLTTGNAPTRVQFNNGARATLAASTTAKIYSDRILLEQGVGLISAHDGMRLEAAGFHVRANGESAQAVVERNNGAAIQVAALHGSVKVYDNEDVLLARVQPGVPLTFEPGAAGAPPQSLVTGTLTRQDGKYVLRDELTNLQVEVEGAGLASNLNRRVQILGRAEPSADKESQKILVSRLSASDEPSPEPQSGGGTPPSAPASKSTGLSHNAKVGLGWGIAAGVGLGVGIPLAVISR
jgi:hypothetical protein